MNFNIISSGSEGNAVVIEDIILIDCGVSFKKLKNYYKNLKLVFISHCHSDHFKKSTVKKLASERPMLRFAVGDYLVKDLVDCGVSKKNIDVLKMGKIYDYGDFKVKLEELYHDVPNCLIKVQINDFKMMYATDTNRIDHVSAKNYDYYFIEGNYENEKELHDRAVNGYYERRVKETHLSRVQATEWLMNNMGSNSKYVFMHEHKEKLNDEEK